MEYYLRFNLFYTHELQFDYQKIFRFSSTRFNNKDQILKTWNDIKKSLVNIINQVVNDNNNEETNE